MRGFRRTAGATISPGELASVVAGLETVCIEFAARFSVDAFPDEYFGWDPWRRVHNVVRARG